METTILSLAFGLRGICRAIPILTSRERERERLWGFRS